jgi:hypothetical protein
MLDVGSLGFDDVASGSLLDSEWKSLHAKLRSCATRRVALEAEEASYLVEAEDTHLYLRLNYRTMVEYMERELHWGPHAANERLRVARELLDLPLIAERFRDGDLCFSAVRELSRVATPATEEAFLRRAQGKTAHHIGKLVAGLKRGDEPDAQPDPRMITKRVVLEVSVETYAVWRHARTTLNEARGERVSDDEFAQVLCRQASETPTIAEEVPRPPAQTAVTTCKVCRQSTVEAPGEPLPLDAVTAAYLSCDAEYIGDLESDELTRVKPTIPAAIRRKVFHRDHFACVVDGCRSARFLEVHHLEHREHGGDHTMANCCVLCFGCHQKHHAGQLTIGGRAPDLEFTWHRDDDVDSAMSGPRWDWEPGTESDHDEPRLDSRPVEQEARSG